MRRGGGGGRGVRQFLNTNSRPLMSMGALVTSQDQFGLQDIDLELELLKRKREIIEKQQEMLRNEYSGENRFSQISQMYTESRGGGFYGEGSGAGKKRPSVWEHELEAVAPKRFTTSAGPRHKYTSQSQFKSQYKPKNSQQSYQSRTQSNYSSYKGKPKPPPAKKRSDFNPSKVTKPSSAQPPNKLKNQAPADAQKLVTTAVKASEQVDESLILRADREPSNQLQGRMGLALGFIMKEIKGQFPQYENLFKNMSSHLVREMKLALRERLRVALIGKYVGSLEQITKIYREVFPPETDREIVIQIIEKESGVDFIPVESDDPQDFYIKNLGVLMSRKIEEMFAKLSEIYRIDQSNQKKSRFQSRHQKADPIDNKEDTKDNNTTVETTKEQNPDNSTNVAQSTSKTDQQNEVKDDENKDKTCDKGDQKKQENEAILKKYVSMSRYQELDRLMSAKLPLMLRKFVPQLQRLMKLDICYRRFVAQIRNEVRKKLNLGGTQSQPINVDEEPSDEQEGADTNRDSKDLEGPQGDVPQYTPLPYFVKILGRPSLPKRKQMQEFFDKYQPKTIKKHRTVHNLLFVGFSDVETYNNILKADGTQIGRFTLSIKVSERTNKTQQNRTDDQVKQINSDLDEQITDLLDSIKKSEGLMDDEKKDDEVIEISDKNDVVEITDSEKQEDDDRKVTDDKTEGNDEAGKGNDEAGKGNDEAEEENDVTVIDDSSQDVTMIDDNSQDKTINLEAIENQDTNKIEANDNSVEKTKSEDTVSDIDNSKTNNENGQTTDNTDLEKEKTEPKVVDSQKDTEPDMKDTVSELKNPIKDVKSTPTRASARLASTPSSVRTRRASKLANDNNS